VARSVESSVFMEVRIPPAPRVLSRLLPGYCHYSCLQAAGSRSCPPVEEGRRRERNAGSIPASKPTQIVLHARTVVVAWQAVATRESGRTLLEALQAAFAVMRQRSSSPRALAAAARRCQRRRARRATGSARPSAAGRRRARSAAAIRAPHGCHDATKVTNGRIYQRLRRSVVRVALSVAPRFVECPRRPFHVPLPAFCALPRASFSAISPRAGRCRQVDVAVYT